MGEPHRDSGRLPAGSVAPAGGRAQGERRRLLVRALRFGTPRFSALCFSALCFSTLRLRPR
ncbi:hypothetical protein [Actinomadura sp. KC345]|uniref:hypothetical protein n=1 Tax=Actinomadura sp. KC345 TaxID=2530371 RepID=UPI0014048C93|nr:hypothetical protein [Actinomadura sp. KC345]